MSNSKLLRTKLLQYLSKSPKKSKASSRAVHGHMRDLCALMNVKIEDFMADYIKAGLVTRSSEQHVFETTAKFSKYIFIADVPKAMKMLFQQLDKKL